jgi:hypothetical protein
MTDASDASELQRFLDLRSHFGQRRSIAKILARMNPGDPMLPVVEAIAEVQDDLARIGIQQTNSDSPTPQKQPNQKKDVWQQLESLSTRTARKVARQSVQAYANQWLVAAVVAMLVCMLAGCVIGYWTSEARSAEARRYWDWNQSLIRECQKQNRKTCNTHVVPPGQW